MSIFRDFINRVVDTARKRGSEAGLDLIRKVLPEQPVRSTTMPRTPRDLGRVAPRPAFSSAGRRAPEPQFRVKDLPPRYQVRPNDVPAPEPAFRVPDVTGDLGIPSVDDALTRARLAVQAAKGAKMEPFKTGRQYVIKTPPVGGRPTSIYGPGGAKRVAEGQVENVRRGLENLARDIPTSRPPSGQLELNLGRANRGDIEDPGTLQSIREIARRAKEVTKDPRSEEMLVEGLLGPQGSRFEFMDVSQPGMRAPSIPKGKSSPAKTADSNNLVRDVFLGSAALGATAGLTNFLGRDDLSSIEFKEGGRGLPEEVIKDSFFVEPTSISTTVVGGVPGQRPPSRITRSSDDGLYGQAVQRAMADVRRSTPGTTGAVPPTVSQQSPENVNVPVITTPLGTNNTKNMVGNSKEAAAVAVDNADPAILEATKPRMAVGLARTPLQAVTQSRNALGSRVMDIRDLY